MALLTASQARVRATTGLPFENEEALSEVLAPFASKFLWFGERGYVPHIWQICFHASSVHEKLRRYRCLVAGRRGGKTLSAAWEVVYYAANPEAFHWDAHGKESSDPLHVWILTPDYRSSGRAALHAMRKVLRASGLAEGTDYKENRGDLYIEFKNGSLIEFKTAERPDKLVGAGLDVLWIDEAALIPNEEAWNIARPALSDKIGLVICTTTPRGKNWFYDLFWGKEGTINPQVGTVEYRSVDNPHFPASEWIDVKQSYHPLLFKQEYMASFDSMAGKELHGEWLKYFTFEIESTDPDVATIPRVADAPKVYDLTYYLGVDPAISLADTADKFAMALIGVTKDNSQAFLIKLWAGRIPFAEQLEKIEEWHTQYRPQYIFVEAVAYQRALADQALRMPGMPNVVPVFPPPGTKKWERILSMAPLFRTGRIRIHQRLHQEFIEEWLDFDSTLRNTKDDCLDAVEIVLRMTGIMQAPLPSSQLDEERPLTLQELANRRSRYSSRDTYNDPHLGSEI
jgi:predicted phage terminase large subunit-like protein